MSTAHGGWVWGAVLCVWSDKFMGKLADRTFFGVQGPLLLGLGRSLRLAFYKFMGKLADRIFFGVQGPQGLGLGCRSLCLAFISLWEN